jgi:Asp-tRNA(Asn)/Glu-tRNA(Gln) amidotransferase A subunit family amidase
MTRNVYDAALAFEVISGQTDCLPALRKDALKGVRLGFPKRQFKFEEKVDMPPHMETEWQKAILTLEALGATVVDVEIEGYEELSYTGVDHPSFRERDVPAKPFNVLKEIWVRDLQAQLPMWLDGLAMPVCTGSGEQSLTRQQQPEQHPQRARCGRLQQRPP